MVPPPKPEAASDETRYSETAYGPRTASMLAVVGAGPRSYGLSAAWAPGARAEPEAHEGGEGGERRERAAERVAPAAPGAGPGVVGVLVHDKASSLSRRAGGAARAPRTAPPGRPPRRISDPPMAGGATVATDRPARHR